MTRRDLVINSGLSVLLLAALAVTANYLATDSFVRVDLSEDGQFSLTPEARQIVRTLDAPVTVEVFLSTNLPSKFAQHTQRIKDKLAEFEAVATVPFEVTYTDPGVDPDERARARRLGIEPRETSARSAGKVEAQITYLGMTFLHRDGTEVLPFIDRTGTLEFEIAQALRKLQAGETRKTVGFAFGFGQADLAGLLAQGATDHPLAPVASVLAESYDLTTVDLTTVQEVPANVNVLIDLGARAPLSPQAQYAIDQHVMRGGAYGVFPYSALPDVKTREIAPGPVDYNPVLTPWGLSIGPDLIVDRKLNGVIRLPVKIRTRNGVRESSQQISSPLVPLLRNLNREHPISRRLDTLVAPFAKPIDPSAAVAHELIQVDVLALTSPEATVGARANNLDPRALAQVQESERAGAWPVLVALQGSFDSRFGESAGIPISPEGTRLLVGTSFELPFANPGLLLSGIDWMAADEILLGIRPRVSAPSMLEVPDNVAWLRLANTAGLPLLVGLVGAVRLTRRSRRGAAG
ncbi:MAG: GldG family protein [Proteobacteria bacterium]|nr:GldG family protein [Pseudomonadota bacterium]